MTVSAGDNFKPPHSRYLEFREGSFCMELSMVAPDNEEFRE